MLLYNAYFFFTQCSSFAKGTISGQMGPGLLYNGSDFLTSFKIKCPVTKYKSAWKLCD